MSPLKEGPEPHLRIIETSDELIWLGPVNNLPSNRKATKQTLATTWQCLSCYINSHLVLETYVSLRFRMCVNIWHWGTELRWPQMNRVESSDQIWKRRSMNERGCLSLLPVTMFIIQRKWYFLAYADRQSDAFEVSFCLIDCSASGKLICI